MPFTATLTNIQRSDQTMDVEVFYEDSVSGFALKRAFNFQNADTVTLQQIQDEVTRVGQVYKSAQASESTLKTKIGTKITI